MTDAKPEDLRVENERLRADLAVSESQNKSYWTDLEALRRQWAADKETIDVLRQRLQEIERERDLAIAERRRAQASARGVHREAFAKLAHRIASVQFETLYTAADAAAIDRLITDLGEEPIALPTPDLCRVDGEVDPARLFVWWWRLREMPWPADVSPRFYIREPQGAVPSLGNGHEGSEAVEMAVMVRRGA